LLCGALTSRRVCPSSSPVQMGRQRTPVLSLATCVTAWNSSQSPSANTSAVIVPKGRPKRWTVPSGSVNNTPATTVFWWMSKPQQRGYKRIQDVQTSYSSLSASQRAVRGKHPFRLRAHLPEEGRPSSVRETPQDQLHYRARGTNSPRSHLAGSISPCASTS